MVLKNLQMRQLYFIVFVAVIYASLNSSNAILLSKKEYTLLLICLMKGTVIALVPIVALPKPTSTAVAEVLDAISMEKYTSVPLTTMSVIFSELLTDVSFLLIAKVPVVSTKAMKASYGFAELVFGFTGELGFLESYGDTKETPFFENFYSGGP